MKTYTIAQLKKIAKEQGYMMAGLENINGERIVSFNQPKVKAINDQLNLIETRLQSEINPDGIYQVCLSHNINKSKTPDRYPIKKGNVTATEISEAANKVPHRTMVMESTNLLSQEKALEMLTEISTLKARVSELEFINRQLLEQIDQLEEEEEDNALSESAASGGLGAIGQLLKETMPQFMPLADRYFNIQEQKLALEHTKLVNGIKTPKTNNNASGRKWKEIVVGSQDHLDIIEHYFNTNEDEKLDRELDKLKEHNVELYKHVLDQLGLEEEEEETDGQ